MCRFQEIRTKPRTLESLGFSVAEVRCRIRGQEKGGERDAAARRLTAHRRAAHPMIYGYARIPTDGQSVAAQVAAVRLR